MQCTTGNASFGIILSATFKNQIWSPGAMVLLKVGSSKPDTFFAGEHLESMGIDGPCTLQRSMGHTLKQQTGFLVKFNSDNT